MLAVAASATILAYCPAHSREPSMHQEEYGGIEYGGLPENLAVFVIML